MGLTADEMTPKVRDAIMTLMQEVDRLRQDLVLAENRLQQMEELADQDPLVPISNRRAFVREISRMISFAERYQVVSSLVFLDVNNMKRINDKLGHGAGDQALTHVAEQLVQNIREGDFVGRLGGDEFGVLLVQAGEEDAKAKAADLVDTIRRTPFQFKGRRVSVSLAHGVFTFGQGHDAAEALEQADKRMYANKRALREQAQNRRSR